MRHARSWYTPVGASWLPPSYIHAPGSITRRCDATVLIFDHTCRFWFSFLVCIVLIVGMIIVSTPLVPYQWQLTGNGWAVILPLALVFSFAEYASSYPSVLV